ncbi:MAG: riboflavin synthase [Candidatus Neomarinimicrobiota bacterium]
MFTGIVEEMGRVVDRRPGEGYGTLVIAAERVTVDLTVGHSICVSGVCLTIVNRTEDCFTVQVIPETLQKSNLGDLTPGNWVNLERAMQPTDRFHGHIVQGHVETVGYISEITADQGDVRLTIDIEDHWRRYCIPKGSIALDGVSLTIAEISPAGLMVALIPYTLEKTTFGRKQTGDRVNIETDIFARYLEHFLEMTSGSAGELDPEKLLSWGFGDR